MGKKPFKTYKLVITGAEGGGGEKEADTEKEGVFMKRGTDRGTNS